VVLDHHPAGALLSTTFAANLTANAVVVLQATNYTWNNILNTWNEIGLQNYFPYNGTDDLVVQITTVNGTAPGGFHRDVRQRVFWVAASGTPPTVGTSGLAAGKFEVGMLMARLSSYGTGCVGSSGLPPTLALTGSSQLGQTVSFDLSNGVPNGVAFLATGFYNGAPFPLDLAGFGMPNCFQYFSLLTTQLVVVGAAGTASVALPVPSLASLVGLKFYAQYACVDLPANTTGITTSNYGRVLVGN